jgi:hypothetical protein
MTNAQTNMMRSVPGFAGRQWPLVCLPTRGALGQIILIKNVISRTLIVTKNDTLGQLVNEG